MLSRSNTLCLSLLASLMWAALPNIAAAQAAPAHTATQTAQMVMLAQEAMQKKDCAKAAPALEYLWDDKGISDSDRDLANEMRINRILCAVLTGNDAQAIALSESNMARPDSNITAFIIQAIILDNSNKSEEAIKTLTAGVTAHPDEISKMSETSLFEMTLRFHDKPEVILPLLIALENAKFAPQNGTVSSYFASVHLKALRDTKDPKLAAVHRAAIARAPDYYMVMMGDGRLSQMSEEPADIAAAYKADQEASMQFLIANSSDLTPLMAVLNDMRRLGQNDQIVSFTEAIIPAMEQDGIDNLSADYFYSLLLSSHALALADLGQHDAAVKAFEEGYAKLAGRDVTAYMGEYLNYLTDMGDEVRALALLETIDQTTVDEDDASTLAQVEACAAFYASDKSRSDKALARLPENDMSRMKPYLCRGEDEKAAHLLISLMALPDERDGVIAYMQNTLTPVAWSQRDQDYVDRQLTLKHRPDVLAAAAKNQINIRTWPVR